MTQPSRLQRTLRHLSFRRADAARAFPAATLDAITDAIAAGERTHRGEVRLIVEKSLPPAQAWAGVTTRQRAVALFADYGIWDTEENCGVLIYVNLAERRVDIVADRGIARHVPEAHWRGVVEHLAARLRQGDVEGGLTEALEEVSALLVAHFPLAEGEANPNELSDHVRVI